MLKNNSLTEYKMETENISQFGNLVNDDERKTQRNFKLHRTKNYSDESNVQIKNIYHFHFCL